MEIKGVWLEDTDWTHAA